MNCRHIEKLLLAYLENELSPKNKGKVEAHLKVCARCASIWENLLKIPPLLSSIPELEVPPHLKSKLYSIPLRLETKPRKPAKIFTFFLNPFWQPVMAVACIFLIILSFFFFHPDGLYLSRIFKEQINLRFGRIEKAVAKMEGLPGYLPLIRKSLVDSLKNIIQISPEKSEKI